MSNDWGTLQLRYTTKGQYKNRKVLISHADFEDFKDFLINNCDAEILATPAQDEAIRFTHNGSIGIVYGKGSGNLTAHDLGLKYYKENGTLIPNNYSANVDYRWPVSLVNNQIQGCKAAKTQSVNFHYCYSCKEVQETFGEQCVVCFSYIVF